MDNKKNNNNVFYWIKKHKLLTICLAIIIYIVIPIIPFIQSPTGIFSKEDATLFLSYYGTIISGITGGALTLGGVWWTINDQKEQREKDLTIQYKPIINIEHNPLYESPLLDEDNNFFSFPVKIINHGRGEALNISIKYNYGETIKFKIDENFLTVNNFFTCEIIFPTRVFELYPITFSDNTYVERLKIKHSIFIEYFDIFNNKYIDTFSIYLEISNNYETIIQYYIEKID
ncbi:hypothetical protein DXD88_09875 [Coprobacillus sp. TM10-10]|jgi:hypothetical protein|uniref:hypothetical protein n=1 Tax=Faecalibacillus intestinalis TaxID=1982626 RepID=UPI000E52BA49|nr:hypothetical protein [Faecalibacillus intestinalis]RGI02335.1 hypothetical protein DXD88_09875 [Coprobacillus sp. TM10-10]